MGKTIIIVVLLILILVFALNVNLFHKKMEGFKSASCCTNLGSDNNYFMNPTPNDAILLNSLNTVILRLGNSMKNKK